MGTVYIIHGCPSSAEKGMDAQTRTYDKHWMPWLKKELMSKGINVEIPLMPAPWEPNYEAYKKEFEKYKVSEEDTLIGHSCGCAFLVRWLGDSGQKVKRLILVAPWKIAPQNDALKRAFYEYPIDESVKSQVSEVIIFTADNEEVDGKESVKLFHNALGGRIIELQGRGHYILRHMGTEEFLELRDIILG